MMTQREAEESRAVAETIRAYVETLDPQTRADVIVAAALIRQAARHEAGRIALALVGAEVAAEEL